MVDKNRMTMMYAGACGALAFALLVAGQVYSVKADAYTKRAACEEAKRSLHHGAARPRSNRSDRDSDADRAKEREDYALYEKGTVDAISACTAFVSADVGLQNALIPILLRTLAAVVAILAFFLAGLRYDADRGQLFGGRTARLDFTPDGGKNSGRWRVSNLGIGIEVLEAFEVKAFTQQRRIGDQSRILGELAGERVIGPKDEVVLETTCRGPDLLVAARTRGVDGKTTICWARYSAAPGGNGELMKIEEGRLL